MKAEGVLTTGGSRVPSQPIFCPRIQKPERQVQGPPSSASGPSQSLAHSAGFESVHHTTVEQGTERRQGGDTGKMWQASCLLINANKYANDESRNTLLTFQFNSSNPEGRSL